MAMEGLEDIEESWEGLCPLNFVRRSLRVQYNKDRNMTLYNMIQLFIIYINIYKYNAYSLTFKKFQGMIAVFQEMNPHPASAGFWLHNKKTYNSTNFNFINKKGKRVSPRS